MKCRALVKPRSSVSSTLALNDLLTLNIVSQHDAKSKMFSWKLLRHVESHGGLIRVALVCLTVLNTSQHDA